MIKAFQNLVSGEIGRLAKSNEDTLAFLKSCEVKVFPLENGQPFAIVIKSDEIDQSLLDGVKASLRSAYPSIHSGQVAIWGISPGDDIDYISLKEVLEKTNVAS
jgi:hypothetical protein